MIFSSLVFLCVFFPITYLVCLFLPSTRVKNGFLIVASLLFYAYGEPVYVLLMIGSALVNYFAARLLGGRQRGRRAVLAVALALNLGVLGIFKYAGFFIEALNRVFHTGLKVPEIALPVGISFFTFQALSYVLDVYFGKVEAQRSFPKVLLYISFFPQLIAGPIVKYRDISREIEERKMDIAEAAPGMRRFICGLGKKVLIANAMGQVADQVFGAAPGQVNFLVAWLGAVAYMLQIYYDFSGYSDMAIGLGRMFGFHFHENFLHPYGAVSVQDFWRKWHVSLSTWFKEYLYIPLGGNRKGRARACLNKIIVFFFTGLWHGANWTFVLWGLYHGLFLLLEEYLPLVKKIPRFLARIYTLAVVCVGFVLFRADTISQGFWMIGTMFRGFSFASPAMSFFWQQMTPWFLVMLGAGILGAAPIKAAADKLKEILEKKGSPSLAKERDPSLPSPLLPVRGASYFLSFLLLAWCIVRLSGGGYNPFIYFRF